MELVEVQPNGERTRGFAATQLVPGEAAWLFAPRGEERDTWVCSADEDATLERVPLGRAGDVTAALALGVLTPDAMARLEDGRFLVAGLGYFVRVTAPRVRGEGGEIEALAQASWAGQLEQLVTNGARVYARSSGLIIAIDPDRDDPMLAVRPSGSTLYRIAAGEAGVAALSCEQEEAEAPRMRLILYGHDLRERWREELGYFRGAPMDLAVGEEVALLEGRTLTCRTAEDGSIGRTLTF